MRRGEQARMFIGLAIPGSGPVAAPRGQGSSERRWFALSWMLTRMQSWSRRHGIEGFQVAYFCTLLGCGVLFGLFVGGYVGFMENATPHADPPYSFAQLAKSDVQWAARARQGWQASHPLESVEVGQRMRETRRQRLFESTATDSGSVGTPSPAILGGHFVRLHAPSADSVPHHPNHEAELSERTSSRTVTDR